MFSSLWNVVTPSLKERKWVSCFSNNNIIIEDDHNNNINDNGNTTNGIRLFPNEEESEKLEKEFPLENCADDEEVVLCETTTNELLLIMKLNVLKQIDQQQYFAKQCSTIIHNFIKCSKLTQYDHHFEKFDLVNLFNKLGKAFQKYFY